MSIIGQQLHRKWLLRGLTMRGSIVKVVMAATGVLAVAGGLLLWTGTKSGVVLADVLARMGKIEAFTYKMSMHMKGSTPGMPSGGADVEMSILIANEYGARMDVRSTDPNHGEQVMQMYWLPRQKMALTLIPSLKQYTRAELDDSMFEVMKKERNDPRQMVRQILDCKYEELGRSVIDGVEVEGFRTTDPAYAGASLGEVDVKIWVDLKTGLPVRTEIETKINEQMEIGGTQHDFRWNVPVSAAEFEPVIPADFTAEPGDGTKMPALTEETAIAGLKLCQELTGKYPDDLNLMTLAQVEREGLERERASSAVEPERLEEPPRIGETPSIEDPPRPPDPKASPEEVKKWREQMEKWEEKADQWWEKRAKWDAEMEKRIAQREKWHEDRKKNMDADVKKSVDKLLPIQSLGGFYLMLVQQSKNPAYYGKIVKPGDAAQVLLRWKTADDQYRVIFGDLHELTVNADTLKRLEAALPK
jgi:hypothetical protein